MIHVEIDRSVYLDCYHHLLEPNDIDIELIWGGRDSGKSQFMSQYLTDISLDADYFRCLLIKETHESIRDAQWQMLKDIAEEWNLSDFFSFKTSPLEISNIAGSTFLTRGMNKPGKIRSIANPSHAWVEEANQISETSFITLLTGLRSNFGKVKLFLTFNPESPEAAFEDWWLYKWFFTKNYPSELNFTGEISVKVLEDGDENEYKFTYRSTHTTYRDNPYCTPQRKAFHESLKETNYYWYNVFTLGLFGNQQNDSPFVFAFNRQKHVGLPELNRGHELVLSWDFNRNPMCCSVIQFYDMTVKVLKVYKLPNMGCTGVCERILVDFPNCLYIVTGDYSGNTDTTLYEEEVSNYTVIQQALGLSDGQIQIMPNPDQKKNRTVVNLALQQIAHEIHEIDAKPLIWDMENVRATAEGKVEKGEGTADRKDPKKQADALDTYRYFINKFVKEYLDIPFAK